MALEEVNLRTGNITRWIVIVVFMIVGIMLFLWLGPSMAPALHSGDVGVVAWV